MAKLSEAQRKVLEALADNKRLMYSNDFTGRRVYLWNGKPGTLSDKPRVATFDKLVSLKLIAKDETNVPSNYRDSYWIITEQGRAALEGK